MIFPSKSLVSILILLTIFSKSSSFIIGIDLGSEFYKIVLVKPGSQSPFSIVENIQSMRKTPTTLFIRDDERVYGSDALNKKIRSPQNVFAYMHEFIGRNFEDPETKKHIEKYFVTYDVSEDPERHSYEFKIKYEKEDMKLSTEEIFGMIFRYIKFLSDKFSKTDIRDCVVTVPNFYGYKQRLGIYQAGELSGLNILGIVNENLGAAIQYALDKKINRTENIIFYNLGSSYTQVTLVNFKTHEDVNKVTNKTTEFNSINILGETWDKNLGGRDFNYNIIRHLMTLFDGLPARKGKKEVKGNPKIAEKMLPISIKVKEILSANKESPVQVLGLEDNMNLLDKLSRETFEKISSDELSRVYTPFENLLKRANLTIDQIDKVELIGGTIRIPSVQEILKEKIGNKLGTHMNGDESVAFGTAFLAANLSSVFRTRRMDINHGLNFEIRIKLRSELGEGETQCSDDVSSDEIQLDCVRSLKKETTLYRLRHGFDISRTVSFKHDSDFEVGIYEKFEETNETQIMTYKVQGIKKALNETINGKKVKPVAHKVHLKFKLDKTGFISLKGELTYNSTLYLFERQGPTGEPEFDYGPTPVTPYTEEELDIEYQKIYEKLYAQEEARLANLTKKAKINSTITEDTNSTESDNTTSTDNSTVTEEPKTVPKNITINVNDSYIFKMKRKVGIPKTTEEKKILKIERIFTHPIPLNKTQIYQSKKKLDQLDRNDELRLKTMERRNYLESYLNDKREWLESKEADQYSTEEEKADCLYSVNTNKEWFEDEGFIANLTVIETKIKEVTGNFTPVFNRMEKYKKLMNGIETFSKEINDIHEQANSVLKIKPWAKDYFEKNFTVKHNEILTWFNETIENQSKLNATQDPILNLIQLESRKRQLQREYRELSKIPLPKIEKLVNETLLNSTLNSNQTINQNETINSNENQEKNKAEEQTNNSNENQEKNKAEEQTNNSNQETNSNKNTEDSGSEKEKAEDTIKTGEEL